MSNPGDRGDNECAICQDVLNKPITLPCRHKFCSNCLEGWRSKYKADKTKTCPSCRAKIPATREMISQHELMKGVRDRFVRRLKNPPFLIPPLPGESDYFQHKNLYPGLPIECDRMLRQLPPQAQQDYLRQSIVKFINDLEPIIRFCEDQIGDCTEILEVDDDCVELPDNIHIAVSSGSIDVVMTWLGGGDASHDPLPERINAENRHKMHHTLLNVASLTIPPMLDFMWLLLQYGAKVDHFNFVRTSPLMDVCKYKCLHPSAMLLLEWGAEKDLSETGAIKATDSAREQNNKILVKILESPLGGRRCEIFGLQGRSELNGQTCVVGRYLKDTDRYAVRVEPQTIDRRYNPTYNLNNIKQISVKSINLKRRDRTPTDPGFIVKFIPSHFRFTYSIHHTGVGGK